MSKKVVGLIMSAYDVDPLLSLYKGLSSEANRLDFTTQGYKIYTSDNATVIYNSGEFKIYETIEFSRFDGLIVVLNSISSEVIRNGIVARLKDVSIPCVAIDCELSGAIQIKSTNYETTKEMVNHLVKEDGYTKINYISGPLDNGESIERLNGYIDGMKENNLPYEERIFHGSFYIEAASAALNYFNQNENASDFEAIMCANDMCAMSLYSALKNQGYNIPEDVAVTGFDNVLETDAKHFSITTITKNDYELGKYAMQILAKHMEGEQLNPLYINKCEIVKRKSCGCKNIEKKLESEYDTYYKSFEEDHSISVQLKAFIEKSVVCHSFIEYVENLKDFIKHINPSHFSIHLMKEYVNIFEFEDCPIMKMKDGNGRLVESATILVYTNGMFVEDPVVAFYSDEVILPKEKDIWKIIMHNFPARQYLNSPLHFIDKEIGFVIWGDSDFPLNSRLYWEFLSTINLTLFALHTKFRYNELYRKDSLTDMYNRYGLTYFWERCNEKGKLLKKGINIIFADVNNLKKINDTHGHEYGDLAILTVAKAMKSHECADMKAVRYGGDELLLLGVGFSDEEMEEKVLQIRKKIEESKKPENLEIEISASFGIYKRAFDSKISMEESIQKADEVMYKEKVTFHNQMKV